MNSGKLTNAFYWLICLLLVCFVAKAVAADEALSKSTQVDILMARIVPLLQQGKDAEAIPLFEQIRNLQVPLPESFDFHYMQALEKSGDWQGALSQGELYLKAHGSSGKYYTDAIQLVARNSPKREAAEDAERVRQATEQRVRAERMRKYNEAMVQYRSDVSTYDERVKSAKIKNNQWIARQEEANAQCNSKFGGFFGNYEKLKFCLDRSYIGPAPSIDVQVPVEPQRPAE